MTALGTGRLWPIPPCYVTSEATALLRQRGVINRSRPEVIWVYVGSIQARQIRMDIAVCSFRNAKECSSDVCSRGSCF